MYFWRSVIPRLWALAQGHANMTVSLFAPKFKAAVSDCPSREPQHAPSGQKAFVFGATGARSASRRAQVLVFHFWLLRYRMSRFCPLSPKCHIPPQRSSIAISTRKARLCQVWCVRARVCRKIPPMLCCLAAKAHLCTTPLPLPAPSLHSVCAVAPSS